jgi:hypothetical protein
VASGSVKGVVFVSVSSVSFGVDEYAVRSVRRGDALA